jgi:hypothetical protein
VDTSGLTDDESSKNNGLKSRIAEPFRLRNHYARGITLAEPTVDNEDRNSVDSFVNLSAERRS